MLSETAPDKPERRASMLPRRRPGEAGGPYLRTGVARASRGRLGLGWTTQRSSTEA